MTADRLREAAAAIRANAQAAGPADDLWYVEPDGSIWRSSPDGMSGDGITGPLPIWASGYAEHIASWSPAVALAVADWLDVTAQDVGTSSLAFHAASAVAEAYLRGAR